MLNGWYLLGKDSQCWVEELNIWYSCPGWKCSVFTLFQCQVHYYDNICPRLFGALGAGHTITHWRWLKHAIWRGLLLLNNALQIKMHIVSIQIKQEDSDKIEFKYSAVFPIHWKLKSKWFIIISWDLCFCRPVIKLLVHDQACSHNAFLITSPAHHLTPSLLCHVSRSVSRLTPVLWQQHNTAFVTTIIHQWSVGNIAKVSLEESVGLWWWSNLKAM